MKLKNLIDQLTQVYTDDGDVEVVMYNSYTNRVEPCVEIKDGTLSSDDGSFVTLKEIEEREWDCLCDYVCIF